MTSRLDRLFVLLESGAGTATRRAAARQLGEVQKAHPEELHRLLGRLMKHLRSPAWETRIAAAQAVGAILTNVPEWLPPDFVVKTEEDQYVEEVETLRCETFNIERILHDGAHLMGSEGHEYDMEEEALSTVDHKERIAKQRQQLNAKLGLDVASHLGMDISSIYSNEDLCPVKTSTQASETSKTPIQELVPSKPLSSREINLAKRKARLAFSKQKSRDCSEEGSSAPPTPPAEPDRKRMKLEQADEFIAESAAAVPDCTGVWGESARWPLERWSAALRAQMFSAAWEARHGAASALRELLAARVSSTAGVRAAMTPKEMEDAHQEWLEDMALRLLCVLALDRFGDFVSDQVVAPVRETCAQTLGVALSKMRLERVRLVAAQLAALARHAQWEARHGALLAFKYLLAASPEAGRSCGAVEQLVAGVEDAAEDVSAAAAAALAARAADAAPRAPRLAARLWALLRDQDELAAPATAYLALLAALTATPAPRQSPIDLADVLPRLWPYMDHTSSSVRKATLETLRTLTRPLDSSEPRNGTSNGDDARVNGTKPEEQCLMWTPELLQEAMRYVYQRVLFEHVHEIQDIAVQVWHNFLKHAPLSAVLVAACPMLATWLCLAMQPARLAVEPALLLQPPSKERKVRTSLSGPEVIPAELRPVQKWYIGGSESQPCELRDRNVMRARCLAADLLGYLSCYLVQPAPGIEYKPEDESPINCYVKVMLVYVRSASALQRLVGALVLAAWARHSRCLHAQTEESNGKTEVDLSNLTPPQLITALHTALTQALYYDEVALSCNRILQEARDLHAMMKHYQLAVDGEEFHNILRLEQVLHLTQVSQTMITAMKNKRAAVGLEDRRKNLQSNVTQCSTDQNSLNVSVQAALASACANLDAIPDKLNPVIRPLMESIKKEPSEELQRASAETLAALLRRLAGRDPCPNPKVLANLKTFLRCDPELTPRVSVECAVEGGESGSDSGPEARVDAPAQRNSHTPQSPPLDKYSGILTLREQQRRAESAAPRRGRPPTVNAHAQTHAAHAQAQALLDAQEDEARKTLRIQRRGAALALTCLTEHFGDELPDKLPKLWEFISQPLQKIFTDEELESMGEEEAEELISRLQVVEVVCAGVSRGAWAALGGGGGAALACCAAARSPYTALRHMAARALAALADRDSAVAVHAIVEQLVPALSDVRSERARCGAAEALARTVDTLQLRAVPYAVLLVVPLLGRMSDHSGAVRTMATRCFACLIQLMPLDGAVPEPAGLSPEMRARRLSDRRFLEKLFNPKSIEDYKIPVPIAAELRTYQQAGVNWLRFLNEYALHGVLCDDMGLGKTLQSIAVVASSHWERARDRKPALPSLVVCPPTLTGHWVFEVNKFIPNKFLKPLQYVGPPAERERLRSQVKRHNLIVASYDIVRKDIDFFSGVRWNYCVLDEGHVIKNGKTKAFKAIKQLIANHRLILSGTPIQNDVLELWSLFDFLMPGLLGTERQFTARYSRPILAARDPRATPHQLQAGALACEALHRQVLPFLLRRVKEDVLKELPPKITQDYYCELSPLQRLLYEHFSKDHMPKEITSHTHVFQALHYLQNVCNHPKLVLTPEHPEAARVAQMLAAQGSSLDDIHHSAKLLALKQLLVDCGIGCVGGGEAGAVGAAGARRALVFCQLQRTLDIVERDLLRRHLPRVHYLRLDGSLPPPRRHRLVQRFNADVSIDLLLLTTKVGGLGLNLTGADTVIFVEHDWNPMKDLQAMDRAHRIGQKKVVNVYRLITRDTLEEKIMGLQKFKLMTANTVISSENAAMETMGTDQLLELFPGAPPIAPAPTCEMEQYGDEYDMDAYVRRLSAANATVRVDDANHTEIVGHFGSVTPTLNAAATHAFDHMDVANRTDVYVQRLTAAELADHADYAHHIGIVSSDELVDRTVALNSDVARNSAITAAHTYTPGHALTATAIAKRAAKRAVAGKGGGAANGGSEEATDDEFDAASNHLAI